MISLEKYFSGVIMGKSALKTRTTLSTSVDSELLKQLRELSQRTMIPMSKLLDRGIMLVLAKYKKFED